MKVTSKGQVTIPAHIRSYLEIAPHSDVDFQIAGDQVVLIKLDPAADTAPSRFARMRGALKGKLTTEEWMRATRGDECLFSSTPTSSSTS